MREGPRGEGLRGTAGRITVVAIVAILVGAGALQAAASDGKPDVRLVLQVTIDQLRGDFAARTRRHWGKGGFRRLFDDGAVFTDARYRHANTETVVGHATLATGADPSVHGMVGNAWVDRGSGGLRYSVADPHYRQIGGGCTSSAPSAPVEPSREGLAEPHAPSAPAVSGRTDRCDGGSPLALLVPTLADSIAAAGKGEAKVFSVSLKDRAAVPMGGKAGKAFWWSESTGEFVSSSYYYDTGRLPDWADAWNRRREADRFDGRAWNLLLPRGAYHQASLDDMPWELPPAGMGRTFPHRFDRKSLGESFGKAVAASPFGDELVVGFVEALLVAERLGRDGVTDYLSVSLSSNDYVGHYYGPDSLEAEDEILRIDRELAHLLDAAEASAGRGHVLVVLSADHAAGPPPEERIAAGQEAGWISLTAIESTQPVKDLAAKFGGSLIARNAAPYVYLDTKALRDRRIDPEKAARALATELAKAPGVAAAYTRGEIEGGGIPVNEVSRAVVRSFEPTRSGDIYVLVKPGWAIAYEGGATTRYATMHGSPWIYDTFVPLVFAGPGVRKTEVPRRVETVDIAPTLAALVGVAAPSGVTGRVLPEAIAQPPR